VARRRRPKRPDSELIGDPHRLILRVMAHVAERVRLLRSALTLREAGSIGGDETPLERVKAEHAILCMINELEVIEELMER
jgi:hypothetical protein